MRIDGTEHIFGLQEYKVIRHGEKDSKRGTIKFIPLLEFLTEIN
jgi:hypothetical protein